MTERDIRSLNTVVDWIDDDDVFTGKEVKEKLLDLAAAFTASNIEQSSDGEYMLVLTASELSGWSDDGFEITVPLGPVLKDTFEPTSWYRRPLAHPEELARFRAWAGRQLDRILAQQMALGPKPPLKADTIHNPVL